ncbi:MAG: hypothetical protein IPJ03_03360 [Ignavibacteriales bacterium]|nr:hypothetical protein [Ignavibacteriales bacterium]
MKKIISIRMLVLSFFLIGVFSVTSAGCLKKDTSEKPQTPTNNNSPLPGDTTVTKDPLQLPQFMPDSLKLLFQALITTEAEKIFSTYPAGYGVLYIDFEGHYHGATRLDESRVTLKWKNAKVQNLSETELQLWIPEINMENISMEGLTIPINLNEQPRDAGISSATLRMYSQLIAKTKDGMIILLGFR